MLFLSNHLVPLSEDHVMPDQMQSSIAHCFRSSNTKRHCGGIPWHLPVGQTKLWSRRRLSRFCSDSDVMSLCENLRDTTFGPLGASCYLWNGLLSSFPKIFERGSKFSSFEGGFNEGVKAEMWIANLWNRQVGCKLLRIMKNLTWAIKDIQIFKGFRCRQLLTMLFSSS